MRRKRKAKAVAYDTIGPAEWSPVYVIRLGKLQTPEQQSVLKRIGRYYKNSCWWSKKDKSRLFDRAETLSWQQTLWQRGRYSLEFEPLNDLKLAKKERAEAFRVAKLGGSVEILGSPAKRHAQLAASRQSHNEQHGSYWNSSSINYRGRPVVSDTRFGVKEPRGALSDKLRAQKLKP
jgi:hypothetical protein